MKSNTKMMKTRKKIDDEIKRVDNRIGNYQEKMLWFSREIRRLTTRRDDLIDQKKDIDTTGV